MTTKPAAATHKILERDDSGLFFVGWAVSTKEGFRYVNARGVGGTALSLADLEDAGRVVRPA